MDPDVSVLFASLPYFDLGSLKKPGTSYDTSLHIPRGLIQYEYDREFTMDRDEEQMFRKLGGMASHQYLRVPQLWVLVLNSGLEI
jgi:hypothetical protein